MGAFEWMVIGIGTLLLLYGVSIVTTILFAPDDPRPNKDDLVILQILSNDPSYGPLIRTQYKDITGTSLSLTSIYDSLHYLTEGELIKVSPQNLIIKGVERKTYETTGKGRATLKDAHLVLE